jgi:hypothetical protein
MANSNNNAGKVVVGLAAVAAAAGAYFLYGSKDAAKNRKKIKGWALRAKGEVIERLENLKELNEEKYNQIVDMVSEKYKKLKNVDPEELSAMIKDMKSHWKNIQKEFDAGKKTLEKATKKVAPKKVNK